MCLNQKAAIKMGEGISLAMGKFIALRGNFEFFQFIRFFQFFLNVKNSRFNS